ncbi:MAG: hypothetical protein RBU30_11895 [Polyangia bacterium]|jgi:hypothetical protein|nr:hypothetical protein [Polyangia bacterium]
MPQLDLIDAAPAPIPEEPLGPPCPVCTERGEVSAMRYTPNATRPSYLRCPRCCVVRPLPEEKPTMTPDEKALYLLSDVADALGLGEVPPERWEAALEVVRGALVPPGSEVSP